MNPFLRAVLVFGAPFLTGCSNIPPPFPTAGWHPTTDPRGGWGLPAVEERRLHEILFGMTRSQVSTALGVRLHPCFESPRLSCFVTSIADDHLFHVALDFDAADRLIGISSRRIVLTYGTNFQ